MTPNVRRIGILVAIALFSAVAGYAAGALRSQPYVLTGDAYAGQGQISALASDGITYAIPVDDVAWLDAKGSLHDNERAECLPPDLKSGKVKFAAVRWNVGSVGGYSVVLVDCRR